MINVKFIVFFVYFGTILTCSNHYETSSKQVLCKHTVAGSSPSCKRYDHTSHLTKKEINEIVNRINSRRNVIAMGLSKHFPQAANMKKIMWSEELAIFAQSWVDQCEQSVHPDIEDQCRDLEGSNIGQNIASILDPSPNFYLKSFVDIWSMHMSEYFGSVSYYNQSRNHRTRYFTQLIWAETDMVGCGRARFYLQKLNTMIERLVCNFSPKGNIHGRPIYHIGYPATQCQVNTIPDKKFRGLCKHSYHQTDVTKYTSPSPYPRVSSLLRILNLSNNSVKQEIDPVRNHWKHLKSNDNETIEQRYQKTRQIFNNTHGAINHQEHQLHQHNSWNNYINRSRNLNIYNPRSRVHYNHEIHRNDYTYQTKPAEGFRKHNYTKEIINYNNKNYCTRKIKQKENKETTCESMTYKCTRKSKNYCRLQSKNKYEVSADYTNKHLLFHKLYSYSTSRSNYQTAYTKCLCNANSNKFNFKNYPVTSNFPNFRKKEDVIEDITKISELHYYDQFPKFGVDNVVNNHNKLNSTVTLQYNDEIFKTLLKQKQDKNTYNIITNSYDDYDYSTDKSVHFYERKKRDDEHLRPFWEVEEFNYKNPVPLKSIKYTTLLNKKKKTLRKTGTTIKLSTTTEPITLKNKEFNIMGNKTIKYITEKYLSFDELMHLRKIGITNFATGARRQANEAASTDDTTITEVTANTPFMRKKHCTRKLTCTWTASSPTGADGSIIDLLDRGSRTPPGYVDGCTRTSTCTRDFMDRNRMATSTMESSEESIPEDEDYCERKSLNIRKRSTDRKQKGAISEKTTELVTEEFHYLFYSEQTTTESQTKCFCEDKNSRVKRDQNNNRLHPVSNDIFRNKSVSDKLSYGDLYYVILQKIFDVWKIQKYSKNGDKCLCNLAVTSEPCILLFSYILFLFNLFI